LKTIQIIVSPEGESRIETKGYVGPECQQASRYLEQALGVRRSELLTAEFYQSETTRTENRESA